MDVGCKTIVKKKGHVFVWLLDGPKAGRRVGWEARKLGSQEAGKLES
jgi:hypothetical protein